MARFNAISGKAGSSARIQIADNVLDAVTGGLSHQAAMQIDEWRRSGMSRDAVVALVNDMHSQKAGDFETTFPRDGLDKILRAIDKIYC